MTNPTDRQTSTVALDELRRVVADIGRAVVAFSGGTDSALVAYVCNEVLGERAVAVTAVSPSLAEGELEHCEALARLWGMRWQAVTTSELENPSYVRNDADRCYWCKSSLMDVVEPFAAADGATVVLGVNLDDLGDHRPGQKAASERGARFPLVEAGLSKASVREVSRQLGLETWDRPAAACLASRLPYGTPVTLRALSEVDHAEAALRRLGFAQLRVRHYGEVARLEFPIDELPRVLAQRVEVVDAVKAAGYRYVTVDLEGFRSGNLNQMLA